MRNVLLVQLPIPPVGPEPIRGNVPLAAGYLKLYAHLHGLESNYDIDIFPPPLANTLCDQALVDEILARQPWLIGFTCYLWNIERTLWIAQRLKKRQPEIKILIGGPEVTLDNRWVLDQPAVDYAAIGEGEQTFTELLTALLDSEQITAPIPGLLTPPSALRFPPSEFRLASSAFPLPPSAFLPRRPLPHLNDISSPYLTGILDAADEQMLLLETIRGCIFKCKFCYYPKSYDDLYFVSEEKIVANLEHARRRGAKEVVLLDPTLNQRSNFPDFLRLLARCNPDRQFTYFGELRAEGITPNVAALLHQAGFNEVEIGLQSIDPLAMELMDRHNNLRSFERGARAMLDLGIKVKVDLIIGLPGDTVDSVRRGLDYIHRTGLYSQVQVFNLAVLPGTSFRQEAEQLGLVYQNRPPYYVLQTPTLTTAQMFELMSEAEELFETQFDPLPDVSLSLWERAGVRVPLDTCHINLDALTSSPSHPLTSSSTATPPSAIRLPPSTNFTPSPSHPLTPSSAAVPPSAFRIPPSINHAQAFTLWLTSSDFHTHRQRAAELVKQLLAENPFTTLQIVLEPTAAPSPFGRGQGEGAEYCSNTQTQSLTPAACDAILHAALRHPTYLDRFYSVHPGGPKGAKRLIIALPKHWEEIASQSWLDEISNYATITWRNHETENLPSASHLQRPCLKRQPSSLDSCSFMMRRQQ